MLHFKPRPSGKATWKKVERSFDARFKNARLEHKTAPEGAGWREPRAAGAWTQCRRGLGIEGKSGTSKPVRSRCRPESMLMGIQPSKPRALLRLVHRRRAGRLSNSRSASSRERGSGPRVTPGEIECQPGQDATSGKRAKEMQWCN